MNRLITVEQWAKEAKCSRVAVYARIKAGTMEYTTHQNSGALKWIDREKYPPELFKPNQGRKKWVAIDPVEVGREAKILAVVTQHPSKCECGSPISDGRCSNRLCLY